MAYAPEWVILLVRVPPHCPDVRNGARTTSLIFSPVISYLLCYLREVEEVYTYLGSLINRLTVRTAVGFFPVVLLFTS
jgi:hypothetical protein